MNSKVPNTSNSSNSHGGKRAGAGRKKGSGHYGEQTKRVRVPESRLPEIEDWLEQLKQGRSDTLLGQVSANDHQCLPIYSHKIAAGFPSPADDYVEGSLSFDERLAPNKASSFVLKVVGDSMIDAGIHDGALIVVDRSIEATHGKIVVAEVDGEFTVKQLSIKGKKAWLVPRNEAYSPIEITEESGIVIWGVVTSAINEF